MGIKRVVDSDFWTDGKVDEFSPEDKYFMMYLLTNPFCRQLGIYKISVKQAAFQMGYSEDVFNVLLDRFENKYGVILYSRETNEIAVKNYLRHSVMKGGKPVEDCIKQDMARVKNKRLIDIVFSNLHNREGLNSTVKQIVDDYIKTNDIDIHNDNDNDNDRTVDESYHDSYTESYKTIIEYLNQRAGTKYRHTGSKTQTAIRARLSEGFSKEDFFSVIDKKCDEWIGTEWEKFLRPETLFGTKFESYLNAKVNKGQQKPKQQTATDDFMDKLKAMYTPGGG